MADLVVERNLFVHYIYYPDNTIIILHLKMNQLLIPGFHTLKLWFSR